MNQNITALGIVKKFGSSSLAYHKLQNDIKPVLFDDKVLISYQKMGNHCFILGDPVGPAEAVKPAIANFIKKNRNVTWLQINQHTADILTEFDYYINCFGVETKIELPFTLEGSQKSDLRLLYNAALKNKIKIREIYDRRLLFDKDRNLLIGYNRKKQPFSFLARPLEYRDEINTRIFGAFSKSDLIAFSLFDPIYHNDKIVGYAESIIQRLSNSPKGSRTLVLIEAMKQFNDEGIKRVELGVSPYYKIEPYDKCSNYKKNRLTSTVFKYSFKYGDRFYNFRGLSFYKSRFRGIETPVYFAGQKRFALFDLLRIYKLTTGSWSPF